MSTPPSEHELIDFVYHEARLLDEKRFEEWYELFTEDGLYAANTGRCSAAATVYARACSAGSTPSHGHTSRSR